MKKAVKIIALLMALTVLTGVMTSCDLFMEDGSFVGLTKIIGTLTGESNAVVASDNYSVDDGMFGYYFTVSYMSFREKYYGNVAVFGIDENAPLDEQYIPSSGLAAQLFDSSETWAEYFTQQTFESIEETLEFCEYALKNGMVVSEDEITPDILLDGIRTVREVNVPAIGHITAEIEEEDIRSCLKLELLAEKGRSHFEQVVRDGITDADIESEYLNMTSDYEVADFLEYTVELSMETVAEEMLGDEYSEEAMRDNIEEIKVAYEERVNTLREARARLMMAQTEDQFLAVVAELEHVANAYAEDYISVAKLLRTLPFSVGGAVNEVFVYDAADDDERFSATVYMRVSDIYFDKVRSFTYAVFLDLEMAENFALDMVSGGVSDAEAFMAAASEMGAQKVQREVDSQRSDAESAGGYVGINKDTVEFKYSYTDTFENYTVVSPGADGSLGAAQFKDENGYKYYYAVPGDGNLVTIAPGNVNIYGADTVLNKEIYEWAFGSERVAGEVTDMPIQVSGGFAVALYEGEGKECRYVDARESVFSQRCAEAYREQVTCVISVNAVYAYEIISRDDGGEGLLGIF